MLELLAPTLAQAVRPQGRKEHTFPKNRLIYCAGSGGHAWRVVRGMVRLDCFTGDGACFAGIALPGDVIGVEARLFGNYDHEAHALTPCVLAPWGEVEIEMPSDFELQMRLAQARRNAAEALALRSGSAEDRMRRLFGLLQKSQPNAAKEQTVSLPSLRNISDITDLTVETASRIISRWRQQGWLGTRTRGKAILQWPGAATGMA